MVAKRHSGKAHVVHPFRYDIAFGCVGFHAALPHIAGRQNHGVFVNGFCVTQIRAHFVYTHVIVRIVKLAV